MAGVFTIAVVAAQLFSAASAHAALPLGSDFSYQAQLKLDGAPLNDTADLEFSLYDADSGGLLVAGPITISDVSVVDGLLQTSLDFGVDVFDGSALWLEIDIRSPHDPSDTELFTTLAPRQPLTAAPYALQTRGIFVDDEGKLGIGTTSPERSLHVVGDGVLIEREGNSPFVALRNTLDGQIMALFGLDSTGPDTGVTYITDQDLQKVIYLTDGNMGIGAGPNGNRLNVNGDANFVGDVGIGTTTPSETLHVSGGNILADRKAATGSVTRSLVLGGARALALDPYAMLQFQNYDQDDGLSDYIGAEILSYNDGEVDAGDLRFYTNDGSGGGTAERMTIDGNGNVGIGTSAPATALDVAGAVTATAFVGDGSGLTNLPGNVSSTGMIRYGNGIELLTRQTLLDQEQAEGVILVGALQIWQSFTAGISGDLAVVEVRRFDDGAAAVVSLYEGEGTGGTLLATTSIPVSVTTGWQAAAFSTTVPIVAGNQYTIQLVGNSQLRWAFQDPGPYAGGQAGGPGIHPAWDFQFRTHILDPDAEFETTMVVDVNGNVGIGTANPSATLDVVGTTELNGHLTVNAGVSVSAGVRFGSGSPPQFHAVADTDATVIVRGKITSIANVVDAVTTSGVTSTWFGAGVYNVDFTGLFSGVPIVTVTPFNDQGDNRSGTLTQVQNTNFTVHFRNTSGNSSSASFNFIAIGKR